MNPVNIGDMPTVDIKLISQREAKTIHLADMWTANYEPAHALHTIVYSLHRVRYVSSICVVHSGCSMVVSVLYYIWHPLFIPACHDGGGGAIFFSIK